MKKYGKFATLIVAFVALIFLTGCPNSLLPTPKIVDKSDSGISFSGDTVFWGAPQTVSATQGLQGRIELTWSAVTSANYYYIYQADSALSTNFKLTAQVSGTETSYVFDDCGAGCDRYYRVASVKHTGEQSALSVTVRGTSLAQPNITDVEDGEVKDSMKIVKWYMSNVNSDTYLEKVRYTVNCVDDSGSTVSVAVVSGAETDKTEAVITGLHANTHYTYYVEAYNVIEQSKIEKSIGKDAETAHRTRPLAPIGLELTTGNVKYEQGAADETGGVTITFTEPEKCDVLQNDGSFTASPLFFRVYRKLESESESDYQKVIDLRAEGTDNTADYVYYTSAEYNAGGNAATVTYTDTSVMQGVKYTYRVQSYTDNKGDDYSTKATTSNVSYTEGVGYTVALPKFSLKANSDTIEPVNEVEKVVSKTLVFGFSFETFGNDATYKYVLQQIRIKDENGDNTTSKGNFTVIPTKEVLEGYVVSINTGAKDTTVQGTKGTYEFYVYVLKADEDTSSIQDSTGITASALQKVKLSSTIVVTDTAVTPKNGKECNFTASTGFKDRIRFTWTFESSDTAGDVAYAICKAKEGEREDPEIIVSNEDLIEAVAGKANGDTVYYDYMTTDTTGANYKLKLERGIAMHSEAVFGSTLGTPVVTFDKGKLDYSTINLSWPAVKGATKYVVSATYEHDPTKTATSDELIVAYDSKTGNTTGVTSGGIVYNGGTGILTYAMTDPSCSVVDVGGTPTKKIDSAIAGKDVSIKVYAYGDITGGNNAVKDSSATGVVAGVSDNEATYKTDVAVNKCYVLGPSDTIRNVTSGNYAQNDCITVTWKKVDGATGYWVSRRKLDIDRNGTAYKTPTQGFSENDGFYVSADGKTVKTAGGENAASFAKVSVDSQGIFTLQDSCTEKPEGGDTCADNQDAIAWGYPFMYSVFPVKNASDKYAYDTGTMTNSPADTLGKLGDVYYTQEPNKVGCALGYGQNVVASKSTDPYTITITFDPPYNQGEIHNAKLKYRLAGYSGDWEVLPSATPNSNGAFVVTLTGAMRAKPYEFAVDYSSRSGSKIYKTYSNQLENALVSGKGSEQKNKGYAFAVDFKPETVLETNSHNLTEQEHLSMSVWDFDPKRGRAVGPSEIEFQIKNLNHSASYETVHKFIYDGSGWVNDTTDYATSAKARIQPGTDKDRLDVTLTPLFTDSGEYNNKVHTGVLEVLRDYKHYARAYAKPANGLNIVCSCSDRDAGGKEIEQFAYRKLRDAEFARCISLIVADGFTQAGVSSGDGERSVTGYNDIGLFYTYHEGFVLFKHNGFNLTWGTNNSPYQHVFRGGTCGKNKIALASPFIITCPNVQGDTMAAENDQIGSGKDGKIWGFKQNTITVTSEVDDPSYSGSIEISLGVTGTSGFQKQPQENYSFTLKKNGSLIANGDNDKVKQAFWIPLAVDGTRYVSSCSNYDANKWVYLSVWWYGGSGQQ